MATRKKKTEDAPQLLPVEDNRNLARDTSSNAILNTNKRAYMKAVQARMARKKEAEDTANLRNEVAELKLLLVQLLEKVNANGNN